MNRLEDAQDSIVDGLQFEPDDKVSLGEGSANIPGAPGILGDRRGYDCRAGRSVEVDGCYSTRLPRQRDTLHAYRRIRTKRQPTTHRAQRLERMQIVTL